MSNIPSLGWELVVVINRRRYAVAATGNAIKMKNTTAPHTKCVFVYTREKDYDLFICNIPLCQERLLP